jgi:Ribbon-helix-helix protein, copG family.
MQSLAEGESPSITVRMPRTTIERLDRECRTYGLSRSDVVRQILDAALARSEAGDSE